MLSNFNWNIMNRQQAIFSNLELQQVLIMHRSIQQANFSKQDSNVTEASAHFSCYNNASIM